MSVDGRIPLDEMADMTRGWLRRQRRKYRSWHHPPIYAGPVFRAMPAAVVELSNKRGLLVNDLSGAKVRRL